MGHHYTPQWLLRNFQLPDRPGFVWQHDKRGGDSVCAAIKQVAQHGNFYDPETESALNTDVEVPGNSAMQKILDKNPPSAEEHLDLVIYVATMLRRGPFYREWSKAARRQSRRYSRQAGAESVPERDDLGRLA